MKALVIALALLAVPAWAQAPTLPMISHTDCDVANGWTLTSSAADGHPVCAWVLKETIRDPPPMHCEAGWELVRQGAAHSACAWVTKDVPK